MGKELKTNAMRFLDKNNIEYKIQTYECREFTSGTQTALALGQSPDMTFKTLVAEGKTGGHYCFLIPVDMKLDLKKASASVGEKSVQLIPVKDINKVTGYVRGGCTPIGMKKHFPTYIHETCITFPFIYISAGIRGLQIKIAPDDLIKETKAEICSLFTE